MAADLIITNARIATMDRSAPEATAAAIQDGRFVAVGDEAAVASHRGPATRVIDAGRRRVIPGLNDSHLHVIRGGLNYNMELRWDGVPSLADAMRLLKEQVQRTPPPQWVRVVGGWAEHQFAEKRLPTLDEVNAVSQDTPVFLLHLYDRALLNRAALRAVGYTRDTPAPPGTELQKDARGARRRGPLPRVPVDRRRRPRRVGGGGVRGPRAAGAAGQPELVSGGGRPRLLVRPRPGVGRVTRAERRAFDARPSWGDACGCFAF